MTWTPGPGDFGDQERALVSLFATLHDVRSVLDLGCGYGRVHRLLGTAGIVPGRYVGIDANTEHLAVARERIPDGVFYESDVRDYHRLERFDLVIAVELLMHLPPPDVGAVIATMLRLSMRYTVSCDWTEPIEVPTYDHNWCHDYAALYGVPLVRTSAGALQSIFAVLR